MPTIMRTKKQQSSKRYRARRVPLSHMGDGASFPMAEYAYGVEVDEVTTAEGDRAEAASQNNTERPDRQLKVEDALAYLNQVKATFEWQPHVYSAFLDIMKEFKTHSIDTPGVISRVLKLFHGHRELILGFNTFLPPGYTIEFSDDENKPRVQLKYPPGVTGPQPSGFVTMNAQHATPGAAAPRSLPSPADWESLYPPPPPVLALGARRELTNQKKPIDFDQAANYVTKIKERFARQPATYMAFLEILHAYQKEQKKIKWVYEQIARLFKDHADLLGEFSQFLPDGSFTRVSPTARWRLVGRMAGPLMLAWRRASERVYAPGGAGFELCRHEFVALSGGAAGNGAAAVA